MISSPKAGVLGGTLAVIVLFVSFPLCQQARAQGPADASDPSADRTPSFMAAGGTMQIVQSRYLDRHWNPGAQFAVGFSIPLTKSIAVRSRFSYHRFHPDWETLRMGPSNWTNSIYFLGVEAVAHTMPSAFGLSPYVFAGPGLYKENIPVHDYNQEIIWRIEHLKADLHTGLGFTGGLGLRQDLWEHVAVLVEGAFRLGVSRERVYSRKEFRARGLLGISVGARYTL